MKSVRPSLGFIDIDYGLSRLFERGVHEFTRANEEVKKLESVYAKDDSQTSLIPALFEATSRMRESGAMLLISAVAHLEQSLYAYAVTYLDPESYEEHLGRASLISRWILTPRICANAIIEESNPAINNLRELITARNSIIHPKRQLMYDLGIAARRTDKEGRRFISACRKAEKTVSDALLLLSSPQKTKATSDESQSTTT
jgi:hypothetical protein